MGGILFIDRTLKYTLTRMAFLLAEKASCRGVLSPQWPQNQRRCTPFRPACKSVFQLCRCSISSEGEAKDLERRAVLLGASTVAAALLLQQPALAEGEHDFRRINLCNQSDWTAR